MKSNKNIVLLVNLGSPNSLQTHAIREFLRKFLSDRRVVNLPKLLWYPILFGIILPFRAPKLLHQYQKIWLDTESPLIYYTKEQALKLSKLIEADDTVTRYAFSYAEPSIQNSLDSIHNEFNVKSLTVIPLYPQFSSTTTLPVFDEVSNYYKDKYFLPDLKFISEFHANDLYIDMVAKSIDQAWQESGRGDKLVFSYHSLPEDIIKRGDGYYVQCLATTKLVADRLNLTENDYVIAFQSKFGKQKWISPSTVGVLAELANAGVKHVDIICPGFVSDCLETLEEVAITNQEIFLAAGGKRYNYIKCLNDSDGFIKVLLDLI